MPQTIFGEFSLDQILPLISEEETKKPLVLPNGIEMMVNCCSVRLRTFKKNYVCVGCGIRGQVFRLESYSKDNPHLNMYAVENGEYILMTKDHIVPKALGGSEYLSNMQTMCTICNNKKGSKPNENQGCSIKG